MPDLRQFEKRLAALISEAPPNAIGFMYLSAAEVKAVFLVARVSGRAHPERGMRVLPGDWQEREAMFEAIWQTARVIGERDADIFHRLTHGQQVTPEERARDSQAEFWEWFDQAHPEEPERFYSTTQ